MAPRLSLDALTALDAIARQGSFAAAAKELHRVPSALSYTIQKMEDDLGVRLFDRTARKASGRQFSMSPGEAPIAAKRSPGGSSASTGKPARARFRASA